MLNESTSRPHSISPIWWLILVAALLIVFAIPIGQLGIHPYEHHSDAIDFVHQSFGSDPDCMPGSPGYKEYWSDSRQQYMFTCAKENDKIILWFWRAAEGTPGGYVEITGWVARLRYVTSVILRDGYVEVIP